MTSAPALSIRVLLTNGSIQVFDQDDEDAVRRGLSHISPQRIFTENTWTIGGRHHVSTFLTRQILRIELASPHLPDWPFGPSIDRIETITAEEFAGRALELRRTERTAPEVPVDEPFESIAVFEDVRGGRVHVRAVGKDLPAAVRKRYLSRLLEAPCLHVRDRETGAMLLNIANVAAVVVHPGPPELPTDSVEARARDGDGP